MTCDEGLVPGGRRKQARAVHQLKEIRGSIVFIDEGNPFVVSRDFARVIQKTDNYYVIATRASLYALPYSVEEVYGIRNVTRSRYERAWRLCSSLVPLHGDTAAAVRPDVVVVEDSNAGYGFFKALCEKSGIRCVSARGRDNVRNAILDPGDESILVVADGAAFGPDMEDVLALRQVKNVALFLPESFEWLVLRSGLVKDADIPKILEDPSEFIESRQFFSWECFFTALLVDRTKDTRLRYKKSRLNKEYLNEREMGQIAAQVPLLGNGND